MESAIQESNRVLDRALTGERITVLGAGVSGRASARLAHDLGADVFVSDAREIDAAHRRELEEMGIEVEAGGHSDRALECDRAVVSSGFPPSAEIIARMNDRGIQIVGELDFAARYIGAKMIGVTGSNGKTTTTSLIAFLLKELGCKTAAAGNIGMPIADIVGSDVDFVVAELSSFQLHWAHDARFDCAIVTNLAPDHIDWHGTYDNYVKAKARLIALLKDGAPAIVQMRDVKSLGAYGADVYPLDWDRGDDEDLICLHGGSERTTFRGEELFKFSDTSLLGAHNMENAAMSLAAVSLMGLDANRARAALGRYAPPPHRCALVCEHNGVRYIDDSKGTNIAASSTALSSINGKKVVILGGKGKGEDYSQLLPATNRYAKWAVLIGEEARSIADALSAGGFTQYSFADDMKQAVIEASGHADAGDAVLLSPACTSWDMYKNYGERGDHFAAVVREMIDAK